MGTPIWLSEGWSSFSLSQARPSALSRSNSLSLNIRWASGYFRFIKSLNWSAVTPTALARFQNLPFSIGLFLNMFGSFPIISSMLSAMSCFSSIADAAFFSSRLAVRSLFEANSTSILRIRFLRLLNLFLSSRDFLGCSVRSSSFLLSSVSLLASSKGGAVLFESPVWFGSSFGVSSIDSPFK